MIHIEPADAYYRRVREMARGLTREQRLTLIDDILDDSAISSAEIAEAIDKELAQRPREGYWLNWSDVVSWLAIVLVLCGVLWFHGRYTGQSENPAYTTQERVY